VPEGDTVWNTAQALEKALAGQRLTGSDFRVPALATVDLTGATVRQSTCRGKHLLLRLETADGRHLTLHSHLRMDGSWRTFPPGARWTGGPGHLIRVALHTPKAVAVIKAKGMEAGIDRARYITPISQIIVVPLVLAIITVACVFAPWFTKYEPTTLIRVNGVKATFLHPQHGFWFGTNERANDMWTNVLYGGRVSLAVGFSVAISRNGSGSTRVCPSTVT